MARIAAEAGRLDVLVNNAGIITPIGHLADLASDDLAPAFAVNVIGVHRMVAGGTADAEGCRRHGGQRRHRCRDDADGGLGGLLLPPRPGCRC